MAKSAFLSFMAGWKPARVRGSTAALVCLAISSSLLPARGQTDDTGYVTAQTAPVSPHVEAYGQVELGATLTVSFATAGILAGLGAGPGAQVQAGQELAHLEGHEVQSLLVQIQADVRSARSQLSSSRKALATQKQQFALHQSTQQMVDQAENARAKAQADFAQAEAHLQAARQTMILTAPVNATVLMADATNGELVGAAQPILTLQTPYQLWLHASYYGFDLSSIRAGMTGNFLPADGSESIPVQVCAVFGLLEAGGGASITLVPANPRSRWVDGEFGTVTLDLPPRVLVAIPTRSLILDQGKWWVLVRTSQGDRARAVVPGPSRGWQTFLENGLAPGTQVRVDNAYLVFHQDISQRYQPPD